MTDKHLSTQFDSELNGVSSRVMELGGLVESQIRQAIYALAQFNAEAADAGDGDRAPRQRDGGRDRPRAVVHHRPAPADGARPAPADGDLQDHRQPGARGRRGRTRSRAWSSRSSRAARRARCPSSELRVAADLASGLLRKALDAFARLDTAAALSHPEGRRPDRQGVRRLRAQADHLHDGRPAHHLGQPGPAVPGQGDRAHRRPRQEHRRVHHLHRQGRRRAPHFDGRDRVRR